MINWIKFSPLRLRDHDGSLEISILTRTEGKAFQGASFFHLRSFEYALTNFLHVLYGFKHNNKGEALYQAPVNWKPCTKIPAVSTMFNIESINRKLIFAFPISGTHIVHFGFSYIAAESEVEKQHMEKLAHDIIDSVKLDLTPETQAKIDAVAKECGGDMRLTESFPPLKWPIKPEDIENPRNDQSLPEELGLFGES